MQQFNIVYCSIAIAIYVIFVCMVIFDGPLNKLGSSCIKCFKSTPKAIQGGDQAEGGGSTPPPRGFFKSPSGRNWRDLMSTLGRRWVLDAGWLLCSSLDSNGLVLGKRGEQWVIESTKE